MDGTLFIIVALLVLAISYRVSLALNPWRNCRRCNGSPGRTGWFFWWSKGVCGKCNGAGKFERWGTRLLARRR